MRSGRLAETPVSFFFCAGSGSLVGRPLVTFICTAYPPHSYVKQWGGCAGECHEGITWKSIVRMSFR